MEPEEACCQTLPLHSLRLSGHLLLQGQLPLFQTKTTAGRESIASHRGDETNLRVDFCRFSIEIQVVNRFGIDDPTVARHGGSSFASASL
jgi:hypothetical protein